MTTVPEKASVKTFIDFCRARIWSMNCRRLMRHPDLGKPAARRSSHTVSPHGAGPKGGHRDAWGGHGAAATRLHGAWCCPTCTGKGAACLSLMRTFTPRKQKVLTPSTMLISTAPYLWVK